MYLIVGLGNPGRDYENTRHNMGFNAVDFIADKLGFEISKVKFKGLIGEKIISSEKCIFLKPSTYMNLSGESVREAADFYKIPVENIIVIYDDVSFNVGRIRIRPSGSAGGHNGMKSIICNLNSMDFPRIRIGIGRSGENMISHVLGKLNKEEIEILKKVIEISYDAVIEIIENGVQNAMNRYNSFKVSQE